MFKKNPISYGDEKWDSNGDHAQLLSHLFKTGSIGRDWPATKICERYPQFTIYPQANFRATVYRYRNRYYATNIVEENIPITTISDTVIDNGGVISNRHTNTPQSDINTNNTNNNINSNINGNNINNSNSNNNINNNINNNNHNNISNSIHNNNYEDTDDYYFESLDSDYEEPCETIVTKKNLPRKNSDGIDVKEDGTPINFTSTTNNFTLGYEVLQWKVPQETSGWVNHITVNVNLPMLLHGKDCTTHVSSCGYKLIVKLKLPRILDLPMIDTRNAKIYKDKSSGETLYPPMHVRSVAHKTALRTLQRNDDGNVELKQVIWLPCKVRPNPVELNDYPGIMIKVLEHKLYLLVVELILVDSKPPKSKGRYATNMYDECTTTSRGGKTNATTRSVYSINYDTGLKNNTSIYPPTHVEAGSVRGCPENINHNIPVENVPNCNFEIPPAPIVQSLPQQSPKKPPPQSQPQQQNYGYNLPTLPPINYAYVPHAYGTTRTENIIHVGATEWTTMNRGSRKRQRTTQHEITQQSYPEGVGVFFDDDITVNSTEKYHEFERQYYR